MKNLSLQRIHTLYAMPRSMAAFVRSLSIYPIPVLLQAERSLRAQVHRDDIRDRRSYFTAIGRNSYEHYRARSARIENEQEQQKLTSAAIEAAKAQRQYWEANPSQWLFDSLQNAVPQWDPKQKKWPLGEPVALARVGTQLAIQKLVQDLGPFAAIDAANAIFNDFEKKH